MGLRNRQAYSEHNTFFITTTCYKWLSLLSIGGGFKIVSDSLNFISQKYQMKIIGYVLMPNHLHLIAHFDESNDRSSAMRDFKKFTATAIRKEIEQHKPEILEDIRYTRTKGVFKIWMDRFDEVYITSRMLLEIKLDYIHHNPLQERWSLVISRGVRCFHLTR